MLVVVAAETVLLILLLVLVAGLLRSHAEILRRLGALERAGPMEPGSGLEPPPATERIGDALVPAAISGVTPDGDAVTVAFTGPGSLPTLLAFLTSGCSSCADFWATLGEHRLPPGIQTLVITHGAERERPARLHELAPAEVPVVMSSQAWRDYRIPGSPYFVLVDGVVRGEGVATTWSALASLVGDAIADAGVVGEAGAGGGAVRPRGGEARTRDVDATLAAAGIGPGHESLYPGGRQQR
jgi:hypothetical protein